LKHDRCLVVWFSTLLNDEKTPLIF